MQPLRCHLQEPKMTEKNKETFRCVPFPAPSLSCNLSRRAGLHCVAIPHNIYCFRLRRSHVPNATSVLCGSERSVEIHRWSVITVRTCKMRVAQTKQPLPIPHRNTKQAAAPRQDKHERPFQAHTRSQGVRTAVTKAIARQPPLGSERCFQNKYDEMR